ncbi:MAG: 4,5-DOPA dioxygenase extradiol [Bacteroidota bacterium]|nr:4,5-DOPA dioxygenase extradiol [Bacteroidota bacterium]MDP3143788.1 4,5-DOPA dioxygenase extradiol [Bacteroidota bacterium]
MDRKDFLKLLALIPLYGSTMKLNHLNKLTETFGITDQMPVLFIGHGNPMNAINNNEFVNTWKTVAEKLPKPKAILCISAHWETNGTFVTAMKTPRTIHDFGGFPKELFETQYPAPGSPEFAIETKQTIKKTTVGLDEMWGLDHGTWSVLKPMYPKADIPVFQLSLDYNKPPQYHYELAKELASLRKKGVLIIGSGNMVHNLGMVKATSMEDLDKEFGFDWALEMNAIFKNKIIERDHRALINYESLSKSAKLAIPTSEHYLPLLYSLALQEKDEQATFFNDKAIAGSLTMTSVLIHK